MLPASTQLLWEAILDAGIFHGFTKGFVNGVEGFCCFEHVVFYLHDSQDSLYLYIYIFHYYGRMYAHVQCQMSLFCMDG